MGLIESELGNALHGPVKRKGNKTQKLRSTAKRVSSGSTEVMVKVTGFGKGAGHVKAHLDYISRNGKVELENDRGEVLSGKEQVKDYFADWQNDFGDCKRHKNQRDTMHMVLSMPETTDPESVRNAVREFAKATFGKNHEYVFALHTDAPHPHCHLTVKCLGFDGTRLNPRKADLQEWREGFADKLRDQGVDAEATPRRARGVVRKAEPNVIRHIERGDKTHKPRVSRVKAARIKEAALELIAESKGAHHPSKPWEAAIEARQKEVRRSWLSAAEAMESNSIRLTFNGKEPHNERPAYDRINNNDARAVQRAAAVCQSNFDEVGRQTQARSISGMRNVSSLNVVQRARAEMLLPSNALDRLGRLGRTDIGLRWAGAGTDGTRGSERVTDQQRGEARALAARIRGFVDAMPQAKDTLMKAIKEDLRTRFSARDAEQAPQQAPQAGLEGVKKGAVNTAPRDGKER